MGVAINAGFAWAFIGFIVGVVWLVIQLVRKKSLKVPLIILALSFVLFGIGLVI